MSISPEDQPPNHYRLLGLNALENDLRVIEHGADRQMAHLRSVSSGPRFAEAQRLLNEVAAARRVLLVPNEKRAYDEQLRRTQQSPKPPPAPAQAAGTVTPQSAPQSVQRIRRSPRRRQDQQAIPIVIGGVLGVIFGYLLLFHYLPGLYENQQPATRTAQRASGDVSRRSYPPTPQSRDRTRLEQRQQRSEHARGEQYKEKPDPARTSEGAARAADESYRVEEPSPRSEIDEPETPSSLALKVAPPRVSVGLPGASTAIGSKAFWVSDLGPWGEPTSWECTIVSVHDDDMLVSVASLISSSRSATDGNPANDVFWISGVPIEGRASGKQLDLSRHELEKTGMKTVDGVSVVHLTATERTMDTWVDHAGKSNPQLPWLMEGKKIEMTIRPPFEDAIKIHARYLNRTNKQVMIDFWTRSEQPVDLRSVSPRIRGELKLVEVSVPFWAIANADLSAIMKLPIRHPRRLWRNQTGTSSKEATYVDFADSKVQLQTDEGKTLSVPISELAKDDQDWLREYHRYLRHEPPNPEREAAFRKYRAQRAQAKGAERRAQQSRNFEGWRNSYSDAVRRYWDQ